MIFTRGFPTIFENLKSSLCAPQSRDRNHRVEGLWVSQDPGKGVFILVAGSLEVASILQLRFSSSICKSRIWGYRM